MEYNPIYSTLEKSYQMMYALVMEIQHDGKLPNLLWKHWAFTNLWTHKSPLIKILTISVFSVLDLY